LNEALRLKNKALQRESEAREKIIKLAKILKSMHIPTKQIALKTGLSETEISAL